MTDKLLANKWTVLDRVQTLREMARHFGRESYNDAARGPAMTEWAHGWETELVRATRYTNSSFGFHIGFSLPKHPHECDCAHMMQWLESKGVEIFQCGGYPGAKILGVVDGVRDVDSANQWLPTFLREFHQWIEKNLSARP